MAGRTMTVAELVDKLAMCEPSCLVMVRDTQGNPVTLTTLNINTATKVVVLS